MRINTRFPVAVHMLALIELNKTQPSTSELMALSVGTNPVVIRQLMSSLKRAGLIETQNGVPGCHLAKPAAEITLREIYLAVQKKQMHRSLTFMPIPIRTVLSGGISGRPWMHRCGMHRLLWNRHWRLTH